jgi:hypothetical protein
MRWLLFLWCAAFPVICGSWASSILVLTDLLHMCLCQRTLGHARYFSLSGRCWNNAASFLGMDGSYHPSVGAHTLDRGSANIIFPPCLYKFSTIERRSVTSASFQALSWPLFDRLFSNSAGLWSVYRVIPALMFLNFSRQRILPSDSL